MSQINMEQKNSSTSRDLKKIKRSFWGFFIQKRPIAWLLIIAIIIVGIMSYNSLPREIQPEINIPFVSVAVALPGANPVDVETLISIPLEEKIANVSNIKTLSSTSGFGFSSVFIEFEASADIDKAVQDVKNAADLAKQELPDDATDPVVVKAEANAFSIITFSLISDKRPLHELTKTAESIQTHLENIADISYVTISGEQNKYINVEIDQKKVESYGLNINQIANLIEFSNNNLPIGIVTADKINYSVRIDNRYTSLEDLRNVPLFTVGEKDKTTIFLKDIATVEETYPTQNVLNRLSTNSESSLPTISLQVFKKNDTNILAIAEEARAKIEELKSNGKIEQDIDVIVTNDNSVFIEEELGNLGKNGIQTALAITIILFFALGLTKGIIAGLSIPVIFLFAFSMLKWQGMTLNTLSLFSLVIALGLIVDTTIVIMEGIHENMKKGLSPKDSALLSVYAYRWPLIAGTFTTIFAFFPMLLVSGILGEFLKTMPITISAALFGSLVVSLTLAPSITTKFVKSRKSDKKGSLLEPVFDKIGKKFRKIIQYIVVKRSIRIMIVLSAIVAFAASMSLPITGQLKVEMFPITDQNYFVMQIETEKGVVITETDEITKQIEEYLYSVPEVDNFLTRVGTSTSGAITDDPFFVTGTSNSNLSNITVNLIDKEDRPRKSYDIAKQIRDHFKGFQYANVNIIELQEGPPTEGAIALRITGKNLETLQELATQIKEITDNVPGTANVKLSLTPGLNEFKFTLDEEKLSRHGLSSLQVSANIRSIIQGVQASSLTIGDEELNHFVKYNLNENIHCSQYTCTNL